MHICTILWGGNLAPPNIAYTPIGRIYFGDPERCKISPIHRLNVYTSLNPERAPLGF